MIGRWGVDALESVGYKRGGRMVLGLDGVFGVVCRLEIFMIVTNTETIPGMKIVAVRGIVQGNTIRAKHLGRDIAAGLKNLVGGELKGYTELLTEARRQSMERMLAQAEQLEANAIVAVRFSTSAITQGAAELYVYGTAVMVEPDGGQLVAEEA